MKPRLRRRRRRFGLRLSHRPPRLRSSNAPRSPAIRSFRAHRRQNIRHRHQPGPHSTCHCTYFSGPIIARPRTVFFPRRHPTHLHRRRNMFAPKTPNGSREPEPRSRERTNRISDLRSGKSRASAGAAGPPDRSRRRPLRLNGTCRQLAARKHPRSVRGFSPLHAGDR
jgi:hypothetical protein